MVILHLQDEVGIMPYQSGSKGIRKRAGSETHRTTKQAIYGLVLSRIW